MSALKLSTFPQTCGKNLERMEAQELQSKEYEAAKANMSEYLDRMFPADESSLFWKEHHGTDHDII